MNWKFYYDYKTVNIYNFNFFYKKNEILTTYLHSEIYKSKYGS